MSIINTMLQDLDKRNGRPGGEAVGGDAIRSIKPTSPWHVSRSTMIVLSGLVVVSAAGAWWMQQRATKNVVVVAAPPVPVVASKAPPVSPSPMATPAPAKTVAVSTADIKRAAAAPAVKPASASRTAAATVASHAEPKATSVKTYSPSQLSANLLAEALAFDQQGHLEEAKVALQRALAANPLDMQARLMLIRLQMDSGRADEARALLVEGQRLHPEQSDFTLALARLKVESGDSNGAIALLEAGRAAARDEPQYHALLGALLLRAQRHDEAVQHYLIALRSDPSNVRWLVGAGVALEGVGKQADAAEAYRRAEGSSSLTPEMASFLSERLARLRTVVVN